MVAVSHAQYRKAKEQSSMLWESDVNALIERLLRRSLRRGWHLPWRLYDLIRDHWVDHAGPLQPTTIALQLGRGLEYDWEQAIAWIKDEAALRGVGFNLDFVLKPKALSSYPARDERFDHLLCELVGLDFSDSLDDSGSSLALPGVDVLWLLALNPDYLFAMDGEKIPYLAMPGLEVEHGGIPIIGRGSNGIFIYAASRQLRYSGKPVRYRPL